MKYIIILCCLFSVSVAFAGDPILVSKDGKYLGKLSNNKFDPDSTSNRFGQYGSQFSPDSVNNRFGKYGSRFSNESANNPYATDAPSIYDLDD